MRIASTGLHLPPAVCTSESLAPQMGTTTAWILRHTGVRERRISELPVERMAALAARAALGDTTPDLLVSASTLPRQLIPDDAPFILRELGLSGIASFSVRATCLSFLVGLRVVAGLVDGGAYQRVLLVSSERGSVGRDFGDPGSAALLGDGAAAALVTPTPAGEGSGLLAWEMATYPEGAELTEIPGGGLRHHPDDPATGPEHHKFHMDGPGVYRMARLRVGEVLERLFTQAGITPAEVDLVVPHQASGAGVRAVRRYGFSPERVVDVVATQGNCVAASLPMALATAEAEGRLKRGQVVLLLGTGAGLSVAAMLLRW